MRESFTRVVSNSEPEDVEENGWKTGSNSYVNLKTQNGGEMKWIFSHQIYVTMCMFMVDVPNKPQPQRLSTENHLDYRKHKKIIDKGMYFPIFTVINRMNCVIMF